MSLPLPKALPRPTNIAEKERKIAAIDGVLSRLVHEAAVHLRESDDAVARLRTSQAFAVLSHRAAG